MLKEGNRKFVAFVLVWFAACAALFGDKLNGSEFVELLIFGLGLFAAGNVGEYFGKRTIGSNVVNVAPPSVPVPPATEQPK